MRFVVSWRHGTINYTNPILKGVGSELCMVQTTRHVLVEALLEITLYQLHLRNDTEYPILINRIDFSRCDANDTHSLMR